MTVTTGAAAAASAIPLLVFELAGERCALPAADVREVLRAVLPARLPNAPEIVAGVLDVRGELVPLVDVRRRFGLPPRALAADDHIVIARVAHRAVAFAVERAEDVVRIPSIDVRDIADVAMGTQHVAGVAHLDDGLLVIHDLRAFLSADEVLGIDRALAEVRS
ncbi:MAG TPA: chemotaxis protein CheW [Candidatus Limnocylindria bacterium]|nr:chemotaxis protein CheW [Candidatus Limnocylindria bacterium]